MFFLFESEILRTGCRLLPRSSMTHLLIDLFIYSIKGPKLLEVQVDFLFRKKIFQNSNVQVEEVQLVSCSKKIKCVSSNTFSYLLDNWRRVQMKTADEDCEDAATVWNSSALSPARSSFICLPAAHTQVREGGGASSWSTWGASFSGMWCMMTLTPPQLSNSSQVKLVTSHLAHDVNIEQERMRLHSRSRVFDSQL